MGSQVAQYAVRLKLLEEGRLVEALNVSVNPLSIKLMDGQKGDAKQPHRFACSCRLSVSGFLFPHLFTRAIRVQDGQQPLQPPDIADTSRHPGDCKRILPTDAQDEMRQLPGREPCHQERRVQQALQDADGFQEGGKEHGNRDAAQECPRG